MSSAARFDNFIPGEIPHCARSVGVDMVTEISSTHIGIRHQYGSM